MALHYRLKNKTGESLVGDEQFVTVDNEMCKHFGVEPDDTNWFRNWENELGYWLASGRDWTWLRTYFSGEQVTEKRIRPLKKGYPEMLEVINYLEENYSVISWRDR